MVHGVAKSQDWSDCVSVEFGTVLLLSYVLVFWYQAGGGLSSPTRDQTFTLCTGRRSLVRWTTREMAKQRLFWGPVRWYADERACPALPGLPPIFFSYDQNDFRGDTISLNFPPLNDIAENPACQRFAFPSPSNVFSASGVLGETQDTAGRKSWRGGVRPASSVSDDAPCVAPWAGFCRACS